MGCTASKLDNDDDVRRCKDRCRLMKQAVFARHHLAAAHADYIRSLRLTGSALMEFAKGESLSVSGETPPVLLHPNPPSPPPPLTPPSATYFHHIPSPSPSLQPPMSPSPSVASSKVVNKLSSSQNQRRRKPPKLPHILSESSFSSSPTSRNSNVFANFPTAFQANSTYSTTPSQASSMWNWENFHPPSPPDSEFFQRRTENQHQNHHQLDDDEGTERSGYNLFQKKQDQDRDLMFRTKTNGGHVIGEETEREEVQCSEWGDQYSTTTSSEDEEDCESRSEIGTRSNFGSSRQGSVKQPEPMMYGGGGGGGKSQKSDEAGSSVSYGKSEISSMKIVVRHKDLKEIVEAIRENFEKAAAAGEQVSEMLEIGRAQLDRSFSQLKKTLYHSSSILSNLSSSWTSKPPLAVKYRLDAASLVEPGGGGKSLCSTLESLLAWEKKLYDEVKVREGVKIQHEKKLSALQSQEYKGEADIKLDKTKTAIKRLHSLIVVSSQAASTTFTAIAGLRDSDLVPQLVELCHGFMYMWRSMHQYHEIQNNIVQQVRGLVNHQSDKGDPTSELHRQATRELESAVTAWHSSFCRLIKFQREFIRSLHGWFKLTLLPVNNDSVGGNTGPSEVYVFCDEWKLSLDRVPDTVASEAIKSFINVVHVISIKQSEEFKIKKQTENASKELEKKASSLRKIEKKFYYSYSMVGIGLPDPGSDHGQVLDARDPLAEKKSELTACQRRVEDEMLRHSKAVNVTRAMTLNNLQTGLPGVFQALTSFSALFTEALDAVCTRSYAIK